MISGISISLWGSFSITPLASKHIPGESIVAVVKVRVVIPIQTSISTGISIGGSFSFSITPLASKDIPGISIVAEVVVGVVKAVQTSISISLRGRNSIRLCFSLCKGNKRQQNQKLHSDETLEVESPCPLRSYHC